MPDNIDISGAELDAGLAAGQFEAVFQPIARLTDGALAGFEALARWRRSDGALWGPDKFLRAALHHERMGLVSRHILATGVAAFARWKVSAAQTKGLFLTANVTGGDLEAGPLVGEAIALSEAAKLAPKALRLEITEQQILRDPDAAARACARLREAGLGVALDDFGAGFASLAWLARLPCDTLKIDRSFVQALGRNPRADKIVRALIALAHDIGLDVVAEGVEAQETRERLADLGCDYAQGHLFAPALSAGGAEALIHTLASNDVTLN